MNFLRYFICILFTFPIFSEETMNLSSCREAVKRAPYYSYPYSDLHIKLKDQGITTIKIFSYGSLMSYTSASKTLSSDSMKTLKPAVAFDVKRLFNRDVKIKPNSKWGIPNSKQARAMLNLAYAKNSNALVNGVVFDIPVDEIPELLYREEGYDLIPVVVKDWSCAVTQDEYGYYIAYTFYAPKNSIYVSDQIDPRPNYYELTRDATKCHGPIFHHLWFSTTYLSDGKTLITDWEKRIESFDPATQYQPIK